MQIDRREFLALAGAAANSDQTLKAGTCRTVVSATGEILSFKHGSLELVDRGLVGNHPRILIAGQPEFRCDSPESRRKDGAGLVFEYRHPAGLAITYRTGLAQLPGGMIGLEQKIAVKGRVTEDVTIELPRNIQLPFDDRQVFAPLRNGVGRRVKPGSDEFVYQLAGRAQGDNSVALAIPVVDEFSSKTELRAACCSDPQFTFAFQPARPDRPGRVHWTYLGSVGLGEGEQRSIYTVLHRSGFDGAMKAFYETVLASVREGPDWVHEIAMVDYDYLSKNGRGWFADIDKLAQVIQPPDRSRVLLALHGWYDLVGRYAFNRQTRSLDKSWVAFPSARSPEVQKLARYPRRGMGPTWSKPTLEELRPVEMSIEHLHKRIRYGKDKGFRVVLYYADGINACQGDADTYSSGKVLSWGGWRGPDTKGRVYAQNPLHPEVRAFYKDYLKALLDEFGKELDGFVWDETFTVPAGTLASKPYPGYADRGMMTLVGEVADLVARFDSRLGFFASDDLNDGRKGYDNPTALYAHGTYQDSGCRPAFWPCGLYSNYRNALWSCNWAPLTNFVYTRYGAEVFETPVAISNGYGDDLGVGELPGQQLQPILDLFEGRKKKRMEITWVEENGGALTYKGQPLKAHPAL